ncbi:hypothetical protein NJH77_20905 [Serratia fonticola]|uniref:hypothetical protein n=1 Tax=Serratia TaxID=613 RepID=UPI00209795AC|nr:hypothetical protein [Serratia fonticola]MCO7511713.1 hypothetical protein [Serratia fonticola]
MRQNWIRHFELQLLNNNGVGVNLSEFKVTFKIEWHDINQPRIATYIKIYNLSSDTTNNIIGNEYSKIRIIAGYSGIAPDVDASQVGVIRPVDPTQSGQRDGQNFGMIFSGDIRFAITGRDNPTDTFVLIQAIDGHNAFINSTISLTLAAGYTLEDEYNILVNNLAPFGIVSGFRPVFPLSRSPRGRVFHGMTRDYLDNIAYQCKASWQFVDGRLDMVPKDQAAHPAIVLNSKNGLIGMPQQTMGTGVNVRCLINPNIRLNGLIQLDQASIYRIELPEDAIRAAKNKIGSVETNGIITTEIPTTNSDSNAENRPASLATDGVYIVRSITITGDTRGQAWYMDMMCQARGVDDLKSKSLFRRTN